MVILILLFCPRHPVNLQYVNKAASSIRGALKEPAKSRLMAQDKFSYKASTWTAGEQGAKTEITSL